jgi:8-oxo-dGTP pyrophosphatase MutT (NUDIX family)
MRPDAPSPARGRGQGEGGWYEAALRAADRPPARPRAPLLLDGADGPIRVGSIEPAIAQRLVAAGAPLRPEADAWHVTAPATPSLAAVAAVLRTLGLAARWRDEALAVVDAQGAAHAEVERAVVRVLGLATAAVHLTGTTADGRTWVQQRADDKATDPGLWDTLMGGQIGAGETVETALARETWEEAGLDVAALGGLRRLAPVELRRPVAEGYLVERLDVYAAVVPDGVEPENRDGEVQRFALLDRPTLDAWLAEGRFTLEASLILGR